MADVFMAYPSCKVKTRLKPASIIRPWAKKKSPKPTYPTVKTGNGREKLANEIFTFATDTSKKTGNDCG
ncbi:MAG: hypothetical protein Kow0065_10390 [Methylomicrobium sp.]